MTTQFGSYDEDNFEIIDTFAKMQPHFDFASKFVEVENERNVILDAFALLGGNENLVNQVVDRLEESLFSEVEEEVVRDLCCRLWASEDADLGLDSPLGQAELLRLLTPLHRDRLHRTLARALLYSGGYEDTRVVTSTQRPGHYAIIISMAGIPGSDLPLGHTPEGGACSRLVILFHWSQASENPTKWRQDKVKAEKGKGRARTISTSLELELKMLSIADMFAVLICP